MLLNAVSGVSCIPFMGAAYTLPSTPFGPFRGSEGGFVIYDVVGGGRAKITPDHQQVIQELIGDYDRLPSSQRERFRRILDRLSQGKRRFQIADKLLDLGIALEMMLLADNANREQLSLTFRLRGSWLVSSSEEERVVNHRRLKEIYNYRSQVAHGGFLQKEKGDNIAPVGKAFPAYQSLAETICRKLLKNPKVDWDRLILGSGSRGHS